VLLSRTATTGSGSYLARAAITCGATAAQGERSPVPGRQHWDGASQRWALAAAEKRGGPQRHVTLDDNVAAANDQADSLLELHEALDHLALLDERLARVVECRFFGGMTEQETAEALHIGVRTVRRDWIKARGLLYHALSADLTRPCEPPEMCAGA